MTTLSPLYGEAVNYAAAAHAGQLRKGTAIPYFHHPLAVSALVLEHGGGETQAIAALLHDMLEDCGEHHRPEIAARFGPEALAIVEALTDGLPDPSGAKPPWRERKRRYLDHLGDLPAAAVLVCAADKLHNAMAIAEDHAVIGEAVFDRFKPTREETVWYYRALERALGERLGPDHGLVRRLRAATDRWDD